MPHRILVRHGHIVGGVDRRLPRGDLLIEGSTIAAIDHVITAADAEVIDATGMLVLPGFVDTHRHTWSTALRHRGADWSLGDYFNAIFVGAGNRVRPEDVYAGTLLGALGALDGGVTTLLDWSHVQNSPAHSDAAVDALTDAGLRAVFGHGWPIQAPPPGVDASAQPHPADLRRLRRERFSSNDGLVTLAMAARGPDFTSDAITAGDFALARELGLRITAHVAVGEPGTDHRGIERMHAAGLLAPDLTLVHAAGASQEALRLMADHGVTVSVAPQIELGMRGLGTPILVRMLAAGLTPSLSVDSETAAASDMFTQMRMALAAHHVTRDAQSRVTPRDVLRWATLEGARATGLDRRTGSLEPGKQADIVLVRATDPNLYPVSDPAAAVVLGAHPGNVDTVIVAGRVVKRQGRLLADVERVRNLVASSREHLLPAP